MSQEEKKRAVGRDEKGRFVKKNNIGEATEFKPGNEVGKETRFKEKNNFSIKYNDEYCDLMLDYFNKSEHYPTFELFAETIGVTEQTLQNWCNDRPRFCTYYQRCKNIQKGRLLQGGLEYKYNSTLVKFIAINCHGMNDKTTSDNTITFNITCSDEIDEESN